MFCLASTVHTNCTNTQEIAKRELKREYKKESNIFTVNVFQVRI